MKLEVGEKIEELGVLGLKIIQNDNLYKFTCDSVFLADFVNLKSGDKVVEFCSGSSVISILLSGKMKKASFINIEIQEKLADMARRSIELNNLNDKIQVFSGDVKSVKSFLNYANVVVVNPPYQKIDRGIISEKDSDSIAKHEITLTLEDVVLNAAKILQTGGRFFMVHRADRLNEIICIMEKHKIKPKVLKCIQATKTAKAHLILISGIKDGKDEMTVLSPLIISERQSI